MRISALGAKTPVSKRAACDFHCSSEERLLDRERNRKGRLYSRRGQLPAMHGRELIGREQDDDGWRLLRDHRSSHVDGGGGYNLRLEVSERGDRAPQCNCC